jgi:hypothetical protein
LEAQDGPELLTEVAALGKMIGCNTASLVAVYDPGLMNIATCERVR